MNTEFLDGVLRLTVPLFTVSLAAFCYQRVGIINLAIDGEIAVAAIVYVIWCQMGSVFSGIVLAVLFASMFGVLLVYLKEVRRYEQFLVGLSFLYLSYGLSRSLCVSFFGNPQYAYLGVHRLGDRDAMIASIIIGLFVLLGCLRIRKLRLASVIGSARDLATIQGLRIPAWCYLHNVIASVLIAFTAIYLVEHGGSFTAQISGQRGFLALAVVAISSRSIIALVCWSVLFAVSQKILYTVSRFPGELIEASPYFVAIVVLISKHWSTEFMKRRELSARNKPLLPAVPERV